jgi:hypothetical protein
MEHKHRLVYDILPCGSRACWDVKKEGDQKVIGHFTGKPEAVQFGRELAQGEHEKGGLSQLRIHNRYGRIEKEWTYGQDPRNIPG